MFFKTFLKIHPALIKMLALVITLAEEIIQKAKIFVQTCVKVTRKSFVNKNAPI